MGRRFRIRVIGIASRKRRWGRCSSRVGLDIDRRIVAGKWDISIDGGGFLPCIDEAGQCGVRGANTAEDGVLLEEEIDVFVGHDVGVHTEREDVMGRRISLNGLSP